MNHTMSSSPQYMYNILFITIVNAVGSGRGATDFREHYLGSLYPMEEYKMYNYTDNMIIIIIINVSVCL